MTLKELLVMDWDMFMVFYTAMIFVLLFFAVNALDFFRSTLKWSFKFLVMGFIVAACCFVSLFSLAVWYVLGETSFINHIQDGDLVEHLRRGVGL